MSDEKVSVIIPVYNGLVFLTRLLETIGKFTRYPDYEIILVDDCSDQDDMEPLYRMYEKRPGYVIVRSRRNLGFAGANNLGIARARGRYVYLLNTDTLVSPGWLSESVRFFHEAEKNFPGVRIGAVQSKIILAQESGNTQVVQTCGSVFDREGWPVYNLHKYSANAPEVNRPMLVDSFMGCGVMISKDLIDKAGGFDEEYGRFYYEDTDLSLRISELGFRVAYNPRSVIVHLHGASTSLFVKDDEKRQKALLASKGTFRKKWPVSRISAAINL